MEVAVSSDVKFRIPQHSMYRTVQISRFVWVENSSPSQAGGRWWNNSCATSVVMRGLPCLAKSEIIAFFRLRFSPGSGIPLVSATSSILTPPNLTPTYFFRVRARTVDHTVSRCQNGNNSITGLRTATSIRYCFLTSQQSFLLLASLLLW